MACVSKSSTPPSQGPPYPPGESKLELTPTELLVTIFGQLSQNDLQSFRDLQDQALVETNRAAHRNMRSLCLTSKRVDRVARPLLLQNITITAPTSLLMLYESLQESPQLGCHVKQISFGILLGNVWPGDFLPLPSSRCTNLLSGWDEETRPTSCLQTYSRRNKAEYSTYCCDQILSCCYFEILRRTPRVHRLVLGIEAQDLYNDDDRNPDLHPEFMCRLFFKKVESATTKSITGEGSEFLPGLKSLQILGDPKDPRNLLQIATLEPLLRLPTLQYFACSQKWPLFRPLIRKIPDYSRQVPIFRHIKIAEFQDCHYLQGGFHDMGQLFPDLESLKLSLPIENVSDTRGRPGRELFWDLQEALAPIKNLRTLVLEFRYSKIGREGRVVSLPLCNLALASLTKLATITIPLQLLIKENTASSLTMDNHLAKTLPESLRRLVLTVQVRCHGHWVWEKNETSTSSLTCTPSSTIIAFIEALSRLGHAAFPYLEEVVCCYSMKGYKSWPGFESLETVSTSLEETDLLGLDTDSSLRLEQLRASIQLQKIRFSVAYENLDCLHDYLFGVPDESDDTDEYNDPDEYDDSDEYDEYDDPEESNESDE